eukprot:7716760-Ditylum_brightwellii.AAC.1
MELYEKAKTPGSTDVDLVYVQNSLKLTGHQAHYMKQLNDGESLGQSTSVKFIYQEVNGKGEDRNAISTDHCSKMVIGTAWTHKHLRCIARLFDDIILADGIE